MAGEILNETEISLVVNDLIKDLDELKEVYKSEGERIGNLEGCLQKLYKKTEELEAKVSIRANELDTIQKIDISPVKVLLEQRVAEIKEAIQKRPNIHQETKLYSVFGDRFGAEQFRIVVDTVMKWVIILIGSFAFISIVKFLINYK